MVHYTKKKKELVNIKWRGENVLKTKLWAASSRGRSYGKALEYWMHNYRITAMSATKRVTNVKMNGSSGGFLMNSGHVNKECIE